MPSLNNISLKLNDVYKSFGSAERPVKVLNGISFEMSADQNLAITGPSGCGKSTLLHLIGTLDVPTTGKIKINDHDPFTFSEPELAKFRNKKIGFVFQDHHLLPQYSVFENVLLPTLAFENAGKNTAQRVNDLLSRVGLADRVDHRPAELSGGEKQRVAIARALVNQPDILLCDEPTGNLDGKTARAVADLFFELHEQEQNILIVVTHSPELAGRFQRRFELQEGKCVAV